MPEQQRSKERVKVLFAYFFFQEKVGGGAGVRAPACRRACFTIRAPPAELFRRHENPPAHGGEKFFQRAALLAVDLCLVLAGQADIVDLAVAGLAHSGGSCGLLDR